LACVCGERLAEIGTAQASYDYRLAQAVLRFEIAAAP
jgi:hypothetical protein